MPNHEIVFTSVLRKGTWQVRRYHTWYGASLVKIRLYWNDPSRAPKGAGLCEDEVGVYQDLIRHRRNKGDWMWKILPVLYGEPYPPPSVDQAAWDACRGDW